MILTADIGNTNIEIGVFSKTKADYKIKAGARFNTNRQTTSDEIAVFVIKVLEINGIKTGDIGRFIYSSVVPQINDRFREMFNKYFKGDILEVGGGIELGITNCYSNPAEVGADRLLNAAYTYGIYRKEAVIVDMGTATTVCAVGRNGEYYGGVIIPGLQTAADALFAKASKLNPVSIRPAEKILGNTTSAAIQSGIYYSNYYALSGIISGLASELGFTDYIRVGTGGHSGLFRGKDLFDVIEPSLSVKALKYLSDLNPSVPGGIGI